MAGASGGKERLSGGVVGTSGNTAVLSGGTAGASGDTAVLSGGAVGLGSGRQNRARRLRKTLRDARGSIHH
ncbi:hypothetical protein [Alistipes sp. ZOR0009]|uniref:hypothetical protein n=1 Tax=Alistipes sp. ZOR0009 TaxID=1339253 RepID=UPI0012E0A3AC|nr:hypothetical protein [Alistipes sp. ZOR0009]